MVLSLVVTQLIALVTHNKIQKNNGPWCVVEELYLNQAMEVAI